ncbi:phospholipid transport system substrate-binding protein [Limimonas halophila]|uniref:Phospholipid transport system substrate-binding protein n=1 Tax=Limimonas halophila TaxID=1082479 RepID=A0A1G7LLQ0_9PROT|nr:ABC transporter substrate-binding protein [Limimonas halophila]SDF50462.1 phospholipid transport system substrate-binding protein [Limimonas halophila]
MSRLRSLINPVLALALAAGLATAGTARAASPDAAASFVQDLGDRAIAKLSDTELSEEQREKRFLNMLDEGFAMEAISRFVLGRYWRVASEEEQKTFRATFKRVLAERFVPMFTNYGTDDFKVLEGKPDPSNPSLYRVTTRIKDPTSGNMVTANWRVRHKDGEFAIVDVKAEGVSMAITLRGEYNSVIQRNNGSVAALIDRMQKALERDGTKGDS